jgi:nucleotide-binding universal stress UspA family protein
MIRLVTVPLDLTGTADRALAPAAAIARQLGVSLELVVVTSPGLDHLADELELGRRASHVTGVPTERVVLSSNDEFEALAPYFEDPDRLVCMASHGRGRLGDMLAPSVTLALVRDTGRPVLVAGPHLSSWPGPVGTILLGVDEKGVPVGVADAVADLAEAFTTDVALVQVNGQHRTVPPPAAGALTVGDSLEQLRSRGIAASAVELTGDPADALAQLAERSARCPIIAVTTRVDTRLGRVLRGSVASRLVARSPVPVLVMPASMPSNRPARHGADVVAPHEPAGGPRPV